MTTIIPESVGSPVPGVPVTVSGAQSAEAMISAAVRLKPLVRRHADQIDAERRIPDEVITAFREAGLFKMTVPVELGGSAVSLETFARVIEEISSVDASAGWCICFPVVNAIVSAFLPAQGAKEIFEPADAFVAGTGVRAIAGEDGIPISAVPVDGGFRVSGRWMAASGCLHANWLFSSCDVTDDDATRVNEAGVPERRFFYFPIDECEIIDTWHVSGLRGTGSNDFAVRDVFVPEHRTLLASEELRPTFANPEYKFSAGKVPHGMYNSAWVGHASLGLTAVCLGIARGALDDLVSLADRKRDRAGSALLKHNTIFQDQLGRVIATLRAARAYALGESNNMLAASMNDSLPQEERLLNVRTASTHASRMAKKVVDSVFEMAGMSAIITGGPFERRIRDIQAALANRVLGPEHYAQSAAHYLDSVG